MLIAGILAVVLATGEAPATGLKPAEISFQVRKLQEENVEGPDFERTCFTAGARKIVFGQPKGWRLSNQDGGVLLLPEEAGVDGEIHVRNSAFTPDFDLAQHALEYREAASKGTPQDATNVEVQPPFLNPFPYNGWKSLGFTWNYAFFGRSMVRQVSYINLEFGVQVVVTTLAAKGDAERVNKVARQFMSSWWVKGS